MMIARAPCGSRTAARNLILCSAGRSSRSSNLASTTVTIGREMAGTPAISDRHQMNPQPAATARAPTMIARPRYGLPVFFLPAITPPPATARHRPIRPSQTDLFAPANHAAIPPAHRTTSQGNISKLDFSRKPSTASRALDKCSRLRQNQCCNAAGSFALPAWGIRGTASCAMPGKRHHTGDDGKCRRDLASSRRSLPRQRAGTAAGRAAMARCRRSEELRRDGVNFGWTARMGRASVEVQWKSRFDWDCGQVAVHMLILSKKNAFPYYGRFAGLPAAPCSPPVSDSKWALGGSRQVGSL